MKQLLISCKEAADSKFGTDSTAVKSQLEEFAVNAIRTGVNNPYLCQYLLTVPESKLERLIVKALDMERLQQGAINLNLPTQPFPYNHTTSEQNTVSSNSGNQPPHSHNGEVHYSDKNGYSAGKQNTRPPMSEGSKRNRPQASDKSKEIIAKTVCNFCQKKGHTYEDCIKRKNTPICANCKLYGHEARECRKNSGTQGARAKNNQAASTSHSQQNSAGNNRSAPSSNNRRVYHTKTGCEFCNRKDHTIDDCRCKQQWEAKIQGNDDQSTPKSLDRL